MSLPVLIGFAGVLVAAVATGVLAGRCVRQPRIGFIVWTAATLGLTIALAAQSMGFASGFGPVTFRAVQLFALLLAPLWLAWGLVELAVASDAARFGMRLISSALAVVASVILATDPLTAEPFSKAWPLTGTHFQPVARDALDVVQAVAVAVAVVVAGLAVIRASRGAGPPVMAVVPAVLAVLITAGQRLPFPADAVYPLLSTMAAALVWFAVSRVGEPSRRAAGRGGRGKGVRDTRSEPGDDYWPDDRAVGEGQYVTYGQGRPGPARSVRTSRATTSVTTSRVTTSVTTSRVTTSVTTSRVTTRRGMTRPVPTSRVLTGNVTMSSGRTSGRYRRAGLMAASVARITLLGRPGCHLCDDARAVIERVAADLGVGWEERDITASPDDLREYWDKIPVTLVDGVQIDFWRVSEDRLRAALG